MSYRAGIAIGDSLAGMGGMVARSIRAGREDQLTAEEHQWDKEDRERDQELAQQDRQADEVAAVLSEQGEKADLGAFDPVSRFKGTARYADFQAKQNRNSLEGMRLEKEKMGMSLQRVQNIGREYLLAREQGDSQSAEKLALDFVHHARNGVRAVEDAGGNKIRIHHMDGTSNEIDKPTPEQMDRAIQGYLSNPAIHIQNRLNEKQNIREQNFKAANNAALWINSNGQEVIAVLGMVDPDTREIKNQFYDASTMQPVDETQVKSGGFQPPNISKDRATHAKARYEAEKAGQAEHNLATVIPKTVFQNQAGGYIGQTRGGSVKTIPTDIAKELTPMEESKYNQVTTDQGEYAFIRRPGKNARKGAIGTGVKAPTKDGADNKVYTVKNPVTGRETQVTAKEIRQNLKEAKAILKDVRDDNWDSLFIPDDEAYLNSSKKEKETAIGRIKRIAENSKNPQERSVAGQVLGYLSALGISNGAAPSWKDLVSDDDKAAVLGN